MPGTPGTHCHGPSGPSGKPAGTQQLRGDPVTRVRRARQSYEGPPDFRSGCRCPCVGSLRHLGARPPPGKTGRSTPGGTGLFGGHIWLGAPGPASLLLALSPGLSPEKTPPGGQAILIDMQADVPALRAELWCSLARRRPAHQALAAPPPSDRALVTAVKRQVDSGGNGGSAGRVTDAEQGAGPASCGDQGHQDGTFRMDCETWEVPEPWKARLPDQAYRTDPGRREKARQRPGGLAVVPDSSATPSGLEAFIRPASGARPDGRGRYQGGPRVPPGDQKGPQARPRYGQAPGRHRLSRGPGQQAWARAGKSTGCKETAPCGCPRGRGAGLVGLVTGQQKATHVHSLAGPHAQPPAAAAEAAFGRSQQSLPSPALTRAALPHTAIHHPRKPGPGEATVSRGHRRREGPAGPGPASDGCPAPPASGPGSRPGKELAPWTGGGHASKTAPKLELEGPSAPAPLRPRGSGGEARGPQAGGRPGWDSSPTGCRGILGGLTRLPAQAVQVLAESAGILRAAATAQGDVPRRQAGLERGWLGRDAWRTVWCPTQAKSPGHQVTEVRDRRQDEGAEVCDGPRHPSLLQPGQEPPGAPSPVRAPGCRAGHMALLCGLGSAEAAGRAGTQAYNVRPLRRGPVGLGARGSSRRREKPQAAAVWEPTGRALAPHGPGMGWAGHRDPDACGIEGGAGAGGLSPGPPYPWGTPVTSPNDSRLWKEPDPLTQGLGEAGRHQEQTVQAGTRADACQGAPAAPSEARRGLSPPWPAADPPPVSGPCWPGLLVQAGSPIPPPPGPPAGFTGHANDQPGFPGGLATQDWPGSFLPER
ncbi:collagen alpha-1(I) chain-like [Cervus elaphus]|uniref:collagen alpha-1(I) chain-like n=1 Tax=Cervus elaphus TaxID=9860 RepID=UPI001CC2E1FA|nr:collagen alpha-1(I) chain-like [Cervus elaphus]